MLPQQIERATPPEIATMPPRATLSSAGTCLFIGNVFLVSLVLAHAALSQTRPSSPSTRAAHPPVCADGVRRYAALDSVPTPFDTLTMPHGAPIRVTSPEEEQAAERQMAARAGGIGATGLVEHDEELDGGAGIRRVTRRVIPVFVPSDSARAQAACRPASGDSASSAKPHAVPKAEALRRIGVPADSPSRADRLGDRGGGAGGWSKVIGVSERATRAAVAAGSGLSS